MAASHNLNAAVIDLVAQMTNHKLTRTSSRRDSFSSRSSSLKLLDFGKSHLLRTEGQIKHITSVDCGSEILCTKFNEDGSTFAVGLANGSIKIRTQRGIVFLVPAYISSHKRKRQKNVKPNFSRLFEDIACVLDASGQVKMWHISTSACLYTIEERNDRQALCSTVHPVRDRVAVGGCDSAINIYDLETRQAVFSHRASDAREVMNGHRLRVLAIQYHPVELNMLISGGWDDTVQIWDSRQEHAVRRIYGPHICGDALDIHPIQNHLMTGSWRKGNELQIWDIASGAKLKDIPQDAFHKCMLYCCQWLGQQHILCGGNDQNMIRIIDRGTLNTVAQAIDFESGVFTIDHDRSVAYPRILVGSAQQVHILKQER